MRVRVLAILFTLGAIVFLLFSVGLIAVLPSALRDAGVPDAVRTALDALRWPVLALSMMVSLSVVYRVAPDRRDPKWRWASWGAIAAMLAWIVGSAIFAFYTSNLGHYDQTYGSLGGVVVVMLWLYLTALVVIVGAELNAELERQTSRDSTVGEPKPRGQRNAQVADALASGDAR